MARKILFCIASMLLIISSMSACSAPTTQSGAKLQSNKIDQALAEISRSPAIYSAANKYQYVLTENLEIRGQHVGAVAWTGRGLVELDYGFVNTADLKTLVSTMLHEIGHIELQHYNYSAENENDAIDWQLAAMAEIYN